MSHSSKLPCSAVQVVEDCFLPPLHLVEFRDQSCQVVLMRFGAAFCFHHITVDSSSAVIQSIHPPCMQKGGNKSLYNKIHLGNPAQATTFQRMEKYSNAHNISSRLATPLAFNKTTACRTHPKLPKQNFMALLMT